MGKFDFARRDRRDGMRGSSCGGPIRPVFAGGRSGGKPDYKTAALCKQVRRVISLTLSGECGDPVLQELSVEEVLPAPYSGRLLVRVILRARAGGPTVIDILQRLSQVDGLLRARIAETIARKRVPELSFDVVPVAPSSGAESEVADE